MNTSNQFTISINALKGLDLLAAKGDIRYYLNGVNVEFSESCTRLVATNGHILGIENLTQNLLNTGAGSLIIPSDIIKALKPVSKNADIVQIKQIDAGHWEIDNYGTKITFCVIEGKFPDYARVVKGPMTNGAYRLGLARPPACSSPVLPLVGIITPIKDARPVMLIKAALWPFCIISISGVFAPVNSLAAFKNVAK